MNVAMEVDVKAGKNGVKAGAAGRAVGQVNWDWMGRLLPFVPALIDRIRTWPWRKDD
jgi:hypothetical protein